jgi:hypothetical protein
MSHFFFRQDFFLCVLEVSQLSVVPADTTFAKSYRSVSVLLDFVIASCKKETRNLKN